MAKLPKGSFMEHVSGQLGKQLVFKKYKDKTVVTKMPDMSRVKPTPLQLHYKKEFKEAVAYARSINKDPEKKRAYASKLKPGKSVFNACIKEYMKKIREEELSGRRSIF
jgi:hypothetical protein